HCPADYFAAARKSLFAVTALPVWIVAAVVYFSIWPVWAALGHCIVLVATGILLVEVSLDGFRKIPFTCSYLPGKANLKIKLGIYLIVVMCGAEVGVQLEYWAMHSTVRFAVLCGVLFAAAIWARGCRAESAAAPN